jgi:hypothetical protein
MNWSSRRVLPQTLLSPDLLASGMAQAKLQMVPELPVLTYAEQHATLVSYLLAKVACADWHGVSDAAMDIRELEAEERGRKGYP